MRTSNPAVSKAVFQNARTADLSGQMTIKGTINKSFLMLGLILITGGLTWNAALAGATWINGGLIGAAIVGFILALVTIFRPQTAHITAPLYALAEGVVLGAVSVMYNTLYDGIVFQAVLLTLAVLLLMLLLYRTGVLRATPAFRRGVFIATGAVAVVYLVQWLLGMFTSGGGIPMVNGSGIGGILFSLVVVGIAAFNLIIDFDNISEGEANGAPKRYEWYGAFALMVTLIWLYLEILRLLGKLRR
ncbi:MAG TPA: Bax inhibitor-1/YccA family protein, partial [Bacteroidales bacterium]|nr:Bax inhibitor-1/YccA family protein [Bacteroidales bacterium]